MRGAALASIPGVVGRRAHRAAATVRNALTHVSGIWSLSTSAAWYATAAPLLGRGKLRPQLGPTLRAVGVRSFPIVALVGFLIGAILVLQTGDVLRKFGQIQEVPGLVALSMTRELGPLMTAFVMVARVGASFTAVLAAMKLNDEITALETMAINPIGYLVAPRMLAMIVMMPVLTVFSFVVGFIGGELVAAAMYDISHTLYWEKTFQYLKFGDVFSGLLKSLVFGVLISAICCYYGFIARGGPMGLGRYTMVAVVTSTVVVVIADAILTAFSVSYLL